jgi:hypothetical protein
MTLTFTYPDGKPNFPRSYCKGFITGTFIDTMVLSGGFVLLGNTSLNLLYHFKLQTRFLAPNTNVYSLDFAFDEPASFATISGIPIDTGAQIRMSYNNPTFSLRIRFFLEAFATPPLTVDLPPVADYWTPI